VQVCLIGAQVKSGAGVCCDWLGWRTDRSVTHIHTHTYIYIYTYIHTHTHTHTHTHITLLMGND